ncbi:hypothetical protein [Ornithinimicrobium pekingense]|uniref:LppX_LprAFG lipoprotein n=1 Tax=Ornithinimicrobium pekingense TaxID=384677 RepID=A0ABQ2FD96_9MICO|nr:hypothetical protein [Ornithinimicrobium pekingense]GGK81050.1 hypothetical protein GCM10011509_31900 [Ornithinimicrobium pekingense]
MSTIRSRWAGLLGAGAITLALAACTAEETPDPDPTPGAVSTEDAGAGTQDTDAGAEEASAAPAAAEGEEVDIQEFVAMLQSPGEETLSSYTMTMNISTGGQSIELDGAVDLSGGQPALDMDMTMPGMGAVRMVMVDGRVFMSMPGVTEEGKFLEVPPEQLGDLSQQLDEVDITSTWDAWEAGAQQVLFVGEEDVDGQDMRRYEVTVDTEAALDAAGQTGDDAAQASAMVGEELTYDVWVDDDNLMRRVAFESQGAVTEILADNWGEPQDIQAPSDDEIQQGGVDIGGQTAEP